MSWGWNDDSEFDDAWGDDAESRAEFADDGWNGDEGMLGDAVGFGENINLGGVRADDFADDLEAYEDPVAEHRADNMFDPAGDHSYETEDAMMDKEWASLDGDLDQWIAHAPDLIDARLEAGEGDAEFSTVDEAFGDVGLPGDMEDDRKADDDDDHGEDRDEGGGWKPPWMR